MENVNISWDEIEELAVKIAEDIKASPIEPQFLYAVGKESLVPAMLISRKLGNVPITDNGRKSYVLFVSTFVDKGNTLARAADKSNCFATAALFLKDGSDFAPDFFGRIGDTEEWYVFPWNQKKIRNRKKGFLWRK